jgi:hypothetical protein
MAEAFTKEDASALWHAVQAFDLQVREMRRMEPPFNEDVLAIEQSRVNAAKRALRKVQAIRRATADSRGEKG